MILGQLLDGIASTTVTYYSPWFPRGGNLAKFTCQVFAFEGFPGGGDKFQIAVETKNTEDSDVTVATPFGGGASTMTLTALAETTWEVGANLSSASAGFKELVRFRYILMSATANVEPWVHFRVLNPAWLNN